MSKPPLLLSALPSEYAFVIEDLVQAHGLDRELAKKLVGIVGPSEQRCMEIVHLFENSEFVKRSS